ncbi:hypothetical protein L596_023309 [Steinernema carpocapsae]|uniref:Fatty-acid and retinol-binding protein 1 n=1 Tax=Steinernema carpocapsae TaxID=34508 RepID=A0A4U5MD85_STECR|nr:hypothetical protein L596_023309 [Steinernema carpocapsae]
MMFQMSATLVFSLLIAAANTLPVPQSGADKSFFDILPDELKNLYKSLSFKDLKTIDHLGDDLGKTNATNAFDFIKSEDAPLADKLENFFDAVSEKFDELSDKPKKFLQEIADKFENVVDTDENADQIMTDMAAAFKKADNLSPSAKQEILNAFPTFKQLFD